MRLHTAYKQFKYSRNSQIFRRPTVFFSIKSTTAHKKAHLPYTESELLEQATYTTQQDLHVKSEVDNVAILHDVVFTF